RGPGSSIDLPGDAEDAQRRWDANIPEQAERILDGVYDGPRQRQQVDDVAQADVVGSEERGLQAVTHREILHLEVGDNSGRVSLVDRAGLDRARGVEISAAGEGLQIVVVQLDRRGCIEDNGPDRVRSAGKNLTRQRSHVNIDAPGAGGNTGVQGVRCSQV